jgi:small subunit ribosomal protein S1
MNDQEHEVQGEELERKAQEAGPSEAASLAEEGPGDMESQVNALTSGQIVDGLIVHIDEHGALVDVGTKSEGHISAEELSGGTTEEGKPLGVGDRVSVYVVRPEDDEGSPVLSKKKADYERVWQRLTTAHERGDVLSAMVTDRVKGGLVVDLGMRGFLPASHVRTRNVHALDRFVGQSVRVKIVEVDRGRKRVVVSQKEAVEQERRKRREQTLGGLEENKVYKGIVRRIADYGAFVDIGGVDGLLHVTEMSWTRINHPSDVVKVGDKIDVMVLRYDREQNRISLGLKQILPDPWEQARDQFRVNQIVTGTVTRVVPFGAFIRLETGIEAIIPNAEMPGNRGQRAQDTLSAGDTVQAKIVSIRPAERRMTLSLRQVQQAQERRELREYMQRQQESSRVTIGDLVGDMLSGTQVVAQAAAGEQDDQPEEEGEGQPVQPEVVGEAAGQEEPPGAEAVPEEEREHAEPSAPAWETEE